MTGRGRCSGVTSGIVDGQHSLGDGDAGPADRRDRGCLGLAVCGGRTDVGGVAQGNDGVCGGDHSAHGVVVVPLTCGRGRIQPS